MIFGLGGILVDSLPAATRTFNQVVAPHLGTELSPGEVRGITGPVNAALLSKFVPAEKVDDAVAQLREALVDAARTVKAYPGVHAWLDSLAGANLQMGLLTAYDRAWVETIIHAAELGGYFRSIVTADDVERLIPDPVGLLKVANQLGVPPTESIYVTDTELEIQMAKKVGFLTAAVSWGYSDRERLLLMKPDVLFDDLSALQSDTSSMA